MKYCRHFILLIFIFLQGNIVFSQAHRKSVARQKIDAKRKVADINSDKAIYRAREFIREDSTYYVGWMFKGVYLYHHAADLLGYKNAIKPLKHALYDISRDFASQLNTRTSSIFTYINVYKTQVDYSQIARYLAECYSNIERSDLAFEVVQKAKSWHFQRNYYLTPYAYMAWIVHRNRFYTSSKYSFLKNSISANEDLAMRYLDSGMAQINKDKALNLNIFGPGYLTNEKNTIYHYKAILFDYRFQIDSSMACYKKMMRSPTFSYNNYANFLSMSGDFRDAMRNYDIARRYSLGEKRLQEWAYFSSILNIYANRPDSALQEMKQLIKEVGSTPGFGWYNIALARAESYNGNIAQSEKHAQVAANFKEVNIGTTLGNSQYAFATNLVELMNNIRRIHAVMFENSDWWYNVFLWPKLSKLTAEKYMQQYLCVNQLALNPERDRVIYPLMASENVISWDEIWYLIRDFNTSYFYQTFKKEFQNDHRRLAKKYFLLFMAKEQIEQGNNKQAKAKLEKALAYPDIDKEYDKLFLARTYEALSICADKLDNPQQKQKYAYQFYTHFPQVVPYSEVEIKFNLTIDGEADKDLVSRLKGCRINWVNKTKPYIPEVKLSFGQEKGKKFVQYSVYGRLNMQLIADKKYYYDNSEQAAIHVAYALFKIDHKASENSSEGQQQISLDNKTGH